MGRSSGFSLEEIESALSEAGVESAMREKVKRLLTGDRKLGRRPEADDALLIALAQAVMDGLNPYAAAALVTKDMPEPSRETTRHRLYKKYKARPDHWQELGRQARLSDEDRRKERQAEARRLLAAMERRFDDPG